MRKLFILIAAIIIAPSCGAAQVTQQVYEDFVRPNDLFRPDGRVYYIPPHTRGDRDFKNRVLLNINVYLRIAQTRNQLEARIEMVADEARPDWTTAAGSTDWIPVYAAPPGRLIAYLIDLNGNRTTEIRDRVDNFLITYSCCIPFNLPGQYFIDNYLIVADTDGNEAGSRTGVSVFFRPVKVGLLY